MNKIRFFRLMQGMQLKQLAVDTGLSMGHLSHLENSHKDPSKAAMDAIAKALSRTVPEVFYSDFTADEAAYLATKEGATIDRHDGAGQTTSA